MNSNFPINSSMQNPPTDRYPSANPTNTYCASVPISVYRELAAELQTAQAMLESINNQNQQLVKQNQQLRQEVDKVLQSAQHLQTVVSSFASVGGVDSSRRQPIMQPEPRPPVAPPPPHTTKTTSVTDFPSSHSKPDSSASPYRDTLVIEQDDSRFRRHSTGDGVSEVNGWFLIVAIVAIVLTAFGMGFLIVRPMLQNNR